MSKNEEKRTQSVMGVPIFKWDGWDDLDEERVQFYEVELLLPELHKFNNTLDLVASLSMSGEIEVYGEKGEVLHSSYLGELDSFVQALIENKKQKSEGK